MTRKSVILMISFLLLGASLIMAKPISGPEDNDKQNSDGVSTSGDGGNGSLADMRTPQKLIPVSIFVDPPVVEVFIDGMSMGAGPVFKLVQGEHILKIVKPGFKDLNAKIYVLEKLTKFRFNLVEEKIRALKIETTPTGADVYLDGIRVGISPYSSFYSSGKHKLQITRKGYYSLEEEINLSGNMLERSYQLVPVDGDVAVKTAPEASSHKMASKPEKDNPRKSSTIKNSKKNGKLRISALPAGAEIEIIDRDGHEYTGDKTSKFSKTIPAGTYELVVTKEGYSQHKEAFALSANQELFFRVNLISGKSEVIEGRAPNIDDSKMIFVKGGSFKMGSKNGDNDELPIHEVKVNSFFMSKYEVTQAEWKKLMGKNPSNFRRDDRPVENISWYDAVRYCNALSKKEGLRPAYKISKKGVTCNFSATGYRLPTEAEWEYAGRGGQRGAAEYDYYSAVWCATNSAKITHQVGTKKSNPLGLHDMLGNVWEWCWDWYSGQAYNKSKTENPNGPSSGKVRIVRGGSWYSKSKDVRVTNRYRYLPGKASSIIGMRLVRSTK